MLENTTKGSEIFQLKAVDVDTNEKLSYSIYTSYSPVSSNCLTIEPWSGIVRLTQQLDRESMSRHVLTLEVADSRFTKLGHRNHFRSPDSDTNGIDTNGIDTNGIDTMDEGRTGSPSLPSPPTPTLMPFAASSHRAFTQIFINVVDVNDHPVRTFFRFFPLFYRFFFFPLLLSLFLYSQFF